MTKHAVDSLYVHLKHAAENNEKCPSNRELGDRLDVSSSAIIDRLKVLVKAGLIKIERFQASRIITIIESGKATAGKRGAKHWRDLPSGKRPRGLHSKNGEAPKPKPPSRQSPPRIDISAMPHVDRDPCIRCGIRRDVGCAHSPILYGFSSRG